MGAPQLSEDYRATGRRGIARARAALAASAPSDRPPLELVHDASDEDLTQPPLRRDING